MKNSVIILVAIFCFEFVSFAQDASSFFPNAAGVKWDFKVIPLDSLNNEINNLSYSRTDSFAVTQNYKDKLANLIVSKVSDNSGTVSLPLYDSTFISFDGNEAYSYFKPLNLDSIIHKLLFTNSSKNSLAKKMQINSAEGWHAYYKFNQAAYLPYQVLSMDTAINLDSTSVTIRYQIKAARLPDETLQFSSGSLNCKKFVFENIFSYLLTPSFAVPLFTVNDTMWIAAGQWVVKEIIPTTKLDLSILNLGIHYLPGSKQELVSPVTSTVKENQVNVSDFKLYQNYPNPFNPTTMIKYSLPFSSEVQLAIYDLLGNEIVTLVNKYQSAGNYEVEFNPSMIQSGISSGMYFYRLKTGNSTRTKKLIYLK